MTHGIHLHLRGCYNRDRYRTGKLAVSSIQNVGKCIAHAHRSSIQGLNSSGNINSMHGTLAIINRYGILLWQLVSSNPLPQSSSPSHCQWTMYVCLFGCWPRNTSQRLTIGSQISEGLKLIFKVPSSRIFWVALACPKCDVVPFNVVFSNPPILTQIICSILSESKQALWSYSTELSMHSSTAAPSRLNSQRTRSSTCVCFSCFTTI